MGIWTTIPQAQDCDTVSLCTALSVDHLTMLNQFVSQYYFGFFKNKKKKTQIKTQTNK